MREYREKIYKTIRTFAILTFSLMASCTGNKEYDQVLKNADSLMSVDDDSAHIALRMLDRVKPLFSDFTQSQRMRYELLFHKAMNKADCVFTSDSVMLRVVDYYNRHGSANDRMLAYYVLGCVYRDMHEAPLALEYYNKATEQADTMSSDCDYATLCRVYSQMGMLFDKQHLPYQELASLDKAVKYAYLAKDTLNAIRYYQNRIGAYEYLNDEDSIAFTNIQAANMFREHGYMVDSKIAYGCNLMYYLERGKLKEANKAFIAYQSTNYEGNSNWKDAYAYVLYEKGMYYIGMEKMDSAYICLLQSLKQCKSFSNKAVATKGLAIYYTKTKNPSLAAKYALMSSAYKDSDLIITRQGQLQQVQAMFDYNRNKDVASKALMKAENRMIMICVIVICAVLLFVGTSLFYRKKIGRRNQWVAMMRQMYNESVMQLNVAKQELERLQNLNENAITALVREKEVEIEKLQSEVKKYEDANIGHSLSELDKQLKQTAIYRKLIYLEKHPQEKITTADWLNLEETIESLVYGFASLKQKLNVKEYHICLLVKLHFTPSSISAFVGTSLSDVSVSRQRMLAKVCGYSGKAKEFDNYIHHVL